MSASDSPFYARLEQASGRSLELLAALAQTDHAAAAFQRNIEYVREVEKELAAAHTCLPNLRKSTAAERKDYVEHQDSAMRRWASRVGGKRGKEKYDTKKEKEEREFLEAWQTERETLQAIVVVEKSLEEAKAHQEALKTAIEMHACAQSELDDVFASIFSGPTPAVPEEDEAEEAVRQASRRADAMEAQANDERTTLSILERAENSLQLAISDLEDATSQWDKWGDRGLAGMTERDSLSTAQIYISEAQRHLAEAGRRHPNIAQMEDIELPHRSLLTDVYFHNVFSDYAKEERIERSKETLVRTRRKVENMIAVGRERVKICTQRAEGAKDDVDRARRQLQMIRVEAVQRLALSYADTPPPPDYVAVMKGCPV